MSLQYPDNAPRRGNGLAVAALILGIMSLVLFCMWHIAMPCAVLAVIFGAIARGTARRDGTGGDGMATAGMVCGLIALLIVPMVIMGCLATLGIAGLGVELAS